MVWESCLLHSGLVWDGQELGGSAKVHYFIHFNVLNLIYLRGPKRPIAPGKRPRPQKQGLSGMEINHKAFSCSAAKARPQKQASVAIFYGSCGHFMVGKYAGPM